MHIRSTTFAAALALLAGCAPEHDDGAAATAAPSPPCERACLERFIDRYLEALVAHDPARAPLAPNVRFVENNQPLAVGEGTWRTVTGLGTYRHYFADVAASQAGMIGVVEESGTKVIYDLRLAIANGQITEIEALIPRDPNGAKLYEERGTPHPKFLETIPPEQRLTRDELVAVANKYLSGMERNDPHGDYSFFHDECDRWEHARRTTNNDPEAYGHSTDTVFVTLNCRKQFETGFLGFVTRIRDRRFAVIDEERQSVFAFAFLDHNGTIRQIPLSSGSTFVVPPYFSSPRTLLVGEAWRIEDRKLRQIEMTLSEFPYGMRPAYASGDDWLARDAAARPAPGPVQAPRTAPCDRGCLTDLADRVLAALVAHAPGDLPLAPDLKYTENGQRLNPGDGLWGTATALGGYRVYAIDPDTGTVGLYSTIVETEVPGLLALRLAAADGDIHEIEAVVFRQEATGARGGTLTLFAPRLAQPFDPKGFAEPAAALTAATPAAPSAAELRAIADSYYAALQAADGTRAALADSCRRRENGAPATNAPDAAALDPNHPEFRIASLGCAAQLSSGYFGFVERVRDRRTLVADSRSGLVLDLAYLDVPNATRSVDVRGVGAVTLPFASTGPYTLLVIQLYEVRDGKIVHIEAAARPVPYGTSSGWALQ